MYALNSGLFYFHSTADPEEELTACFSWNESSGLLTQLEGEFDLPILGLRPARVILWDANSRSFQEPNPQAVSNRRSLIWAFPGEITETLTWDPADWSWRKTDKFREAPFFGYTSKREYL